MAALPLALAAVAACSPLKTINAVTSSSSYTKTADLAYGANPRQKLDIYAPSAPASSPAPVAVFVYGGNWRMGERADYQFVAEALTSRGILVVVIDYRLYPEVRYPGFVEDTAQAVAWTYREIGRYGGDPRKLFLIGHSAGAYNAAMVALDPRWLKVHGMQPEQLRGWAGLAGPYNFIPIENPDVKPVFFHPDTPPESQPINHIGPHTPPALLLAPEQDKVVNPLRNTGALNEKLRAAGVPATAHYYPRTSHSTLIGAMAWPLRHLAPVRDAVAEFILSDGGRGAVH
ncbi:MAG TPA: alpha/beta hydrolase [Burkholderiaceae bacterium]